MLALGRFELGVGPCGFHKSLTSDLSNHFTFEDEHCSVCKGIAQYERVQAEADERAVKALGEKPPAIAPRPSDGRRTLTRMMSPAEVEARKVSRGSRPGRPG